MVHAENFDKSVVNDRGTQSNASGLQQQFQEVGASSRSSAYDAMKGPNTASSYLPSANEMLGALNNLNAEGKQSGRNSFGSGSPDGVQTGLWREGMKTPEAQTMPWREGMKTPEAKTMPWLIKPGDKNNGIPLMPPDQRLPGEPLKPFEPPKSGEPLKPGQPLIPGEPCKPENPLVPESPVDTDPPEDPESPDSPEKPENPEAPGTPEIPEVPRCPADPENPLSPENPFKPEPDAPECPENPENPHDIVDPGEILCPEPPPQLDKHGRKITPLLPPNFFGKPGQKPMPIEPKIETVLL